MARTTSRHRCTPNRPCHTNRKVAAIFQRYYSGGGAPALSISSDPAVEFTGAESLVGDQSGTHNLHAPRALWRDGKTYHSYHGIWQSEGLGQGYVVVYDENNGVTKPYRITNTEPSADPHTTPCIHIDDEGNIYCFQERVHDSPIDIYKGSDFNYFEYLDEKIGEGGEQGGQLSYIQMLKDQNGNGIAWCRTLRSDFSYSGMHSAVVKASDGFESWGDIVRVATNPRPQQEPPHLDNRTRLYPSIPFYRQSVGDYWYVMVSLRKEDNSVVYGTDICWQKFYLLKTHKTNNPFIVFYNADGSYSHDTSDENYITETVLDTHFMYYDNGVLNGHIPVATLGSDGTFYCVTGDGTGDLLLHIVNQSGTTTKTLNIENYVKSATKQASAVKHIAHVNNYLEIAITIDEGAVNKMHLFKSLDNGDTWDDLGDMTPEIETSVSTVCFPFNYYEIPNNRNFALVFQQTDTDTPNTRKLYVKRAAKGTIQAETPSIVVPAASYSDAFDLFHYRATDDAIIRSGNNVSAMVDQFGLRNATGVNNPQWNGSDEISLNGTNQYFSISPTGLTSLTKLTLMALVKAPVGSHGNILTMADATKFAEFIAFIGYLPTLLGPAYSYRDAALDTNLREYALIDTNDGEYHLFVFVVDGKCKVDIYVDGFKDFYRSDGYSSITDFAKRGHLDFGSVNSVRIGSRAFTGGAGETFVPLTIKEMICKHTVYDYSTQRSLEKKLADAHGITLNYGYL